ncbi:MAG: hypothetical protein ASARMPREDX12_005445 [Alectoria sarmentosa]|nr:MAG: hypothetical protein ASARMPREDX12_005445 [Alectoria sarmentosa]
MNDQHGPPPAEAASAETRLKGHVGHLTREEESAFDEFRKLAAKQGFYTPAADDKKASHDDGTLVYAVPRLLTPLIFPFKDTEIWRKDNDLDALYEKIDIHDYQEARSVYPQWTGRRDKRGIPVYLYEVGKLDSKKMIAYSSATSKSKSRGPSPSRMLRLFALYENLTRFVMPLCSAVPGRPNPETPVDQSNNIVDISHVGLKQFWNLRSHMQDASQLATAHYPETLDRIFIIGAPSFFPTVWGWIKKWFDPITTSKIFILSHHQVLPTLSSFIDIADIPKKYGGGLDFECGKLPVLDQQVRDCLSITAGPGAEKMFLTAPVRWIDAGDDDEMTALGVGSMDGKQRKETVATLHSLAVRVATSSSRHTQSWSETVGAPASRPPTHHSQNVQPRPVSKGQNNQPTSIEPAPIANISTTSLHDRKLPVLQHPLQNGGPPDKIRMPPPTQIERTKTDFFTPPSDPSEMKTFE